MFIELYSPNRGNLQVAMGNRKYDAPVRPEGLRGSLIRGHLMMCPRCKRDQDVLRYRPLLEIDEHKDETVPIYKCPSCLWEFALAERTILEVLGRDAIA